jgi:NAD(P)-dependent dehydrogenase (short-subunit alcohol dehydrogenase family)
MMQNKMGWVLITGANGGIGKALVNTFANNGYPVIATDIQKLSDTRENVVNIQLDLESFVTDETYAASLYEEVTGITKSEGISALLNNAAVQTLGDISVISRKDWLSSFNVNLHAPFFMSQLFLNDLMKNSGAIVNISSIHALQTKREFVTYATTKGALSSLTRNMAVDLGNRVRINAIEPAAVSTDMLKAGFEGKEDEYKLLEAFHPLARIATPEEVADLAVYLCSEKSSFIHGACISATGGIHGCLSDPS